MASIIAPLLTISNQIKIFHWQTPSFSEHKALDETYEKLEALTDSFVEVYQGLFGRIYAQESFLIELKNYISSEVGYSSNINESIDGWVEYLKSFNFDSQISGHSDLLNIRDEMLASLNQLRYLITLM